MGTPKVKLPAAPALVRQEYTPFDVNALKLLDPTAANTLGKERDAGYYRDSDADYAKRFPELVAANARVRQQVGQEATADVESARLPPAVQAELQRAGLASTLGTFDSVTPGSIGAYGLGRNLGVGALNYVNMLRGQREQARDRLAGLTEANPQRSFGLTGQDAVNLQLNNLGEQNQVNLGNNAGTNAASAANAQAQNSINQQQYGAQVQAAIANARPSGLGGAIGGALGAVAGFIPGVGSLVGGPVGGFRIGSGLGGAFG